MSMPAAKHTGLLLTVLVLLSTLPACGFQLRGAAPVAPVAPVLQNTRIQGVANFTDLYLELKRNLERAGSQVLDDAKTSAAVLNITQEQLTRRVLTVDAQGRASEYELTYRVGFEVRSAGGETLVPAQSISLLRDYKFDPDNVLAKDTEEQALRKALVTAAVQQMMRRIDAIMKTKHESKS
jgi:LPS-assembly lipoprotein